MLILSSSPRLFGSIAYEITGSGNLIGANADGRRSCRRCRSLVCVSFSFATAPRSPALISGTLRLRLALQQRRGGRDAPASPASCSAPSSPTCSVPETTRNSVMRPANGSATVFHTKAAAGPLSAAATVTSLLAVLVLGVERPLGGRLARRRRSRRAAAACRCWWWPTCTPRGKIRPAATPRLSPDTSSSCVSVPASKNFSISASSASATISMSASRARCASAASSDGHFAFRRLAAARRLRRSRPSSTRDRHAAESLLFADRKLNRNDRASEHRCAATRATARGSRARGPAG